MARSLYGEASGEPSSCNTTKERLSNHAALYTPAADFHRDPITRGLEVATPASMSPPLHIPRSPSLEINELGAQFFFNTYTFDGPPYSATYLSWLSEAYREDRPRHALREALQAAGMAGMSNVWRDSSAASTAKTQYCRALAATNLALRDPEEAIQDTTLMAVILLGAFEVSFCSRYLTQQV